MATTIVPSTMTVTISKSITLNGQQQGGSQIFTIASINEITRRITTCPASQSTKILNFSTNVYDAAQAIDVNDCKYVRITNLDNTNSVELGIVGASSNYQITLAAGQSHILGATDDFMLAEEDQTPSFGTMTDVTTISCNPAANAVDLEVFTASI